MVWCRYEVASSTIATVSRRALSRGRSRDRGDIIQSDAAWRQFIFGDELNRDAIAVAADFKRGAVERRAVF